MKICSKCKKDLDVESFSSDKSRKDGLSHRCKLCQSKLSKKHFVDNRREYCNRQEARRIKHANIMMKIKVDSGCSVCGENRPPCLDFHHVDASEKDFTISTCLSYSLDRLLKEAGKCIVLCANCHRMIHSSS